MFAAPIMGTTSDVLNDFVSPGSLGCRSTTTADCMDTTRLQLPLLERKDHVEGQEGGTKDAPIIDPNTTQKAGKVYESFYSAPSHEKSRAEPYYEEHHEIQEITDYDVPDLNTSGMMRTSVCDLLPVPATDV